MNPPPDLAHQIAKFKARRRKTHLAYYGLLITLILSFSSFNAGFSLPALTSFLLFLPLLLYFVLQAFTLRAKYRALKERAAEIIRTIPPFSPVFSLKSYLTQPSLSFRLTLILFLLVTATALARLHTKNPSLAIDLRPPIVVH